MAAMTPEELFARLETRQENAAAKEGLTNLEPRLIKRLAGLVIAATAFATLIERIT